MANIFSRVRSNCVSSSCTIGDLTSWDWLFTEGLFRLAKRLFRFAERLFGCTEGLFRFAKRLFRFDKRLFRFAKEVFRFNERLFGFVGRMCFLRHLPGMCMSSFRSVVWFCNVLIYDCYLN